MPEMTKADYIRAAIRDNPDMKSGEIAEMLTNQLGKSVKSQEVSQYRVKEAKRQKEDESISEPTFTPAPYQPPPPPASTPDTTPAPPAEKSIPLKELGRVMQAAKYLISVFGSKEDAKKFFDTI